jgi:hypothetical protein
MINKNKVSITLANMQCRLLNVSKVSVFHYILLSLLFLFILNSELAKAQLNLDLESGVVAVGYNNVSIPGDIGDRISLNEDLKCNSKIYYRIKVNYSINQHHKISLLYAPLKIESTGRIPKSIYFSNQLFQANTDLDATYKFNSYRVSYSYNFMPKPNLDIGIGMTAKIRDAKISIQSASTYGELTDLGFVPLINFKIGWRYYNKLGILLEGDALAAKYGRAEDVIICATYKYSDHIEFKAGYRILEGGSDSKKVYTFALFNYAALGILVYL